MRGDVDGVEELEEAADEVCDVTDEECVGEVGAVVGGGGEYDWLGVMVVVVALLDVVVVVVAVVECWDGGEK